MNQHRVLLMKIGVTGGAALAFICHLIWPNLSIDAVSLGLLAIGLVPWLAPLIKSVELPGGLKVSLQDVKAAEASVIGGSREKAPRSAPPAPRMSLFPEIDPNIALLKLRVELERRLREAALAKGLDANIPLVRLVQELRDRAILSPSVAVGVGNLINAANIAAHGAEVDLNIVSWANLNGPQVLDAVENDLWPERRGANLG
jgi:hypothetical protein